MDKAIICRWCGRDMSHEEHVCAICRTSIPSTGRFSWTETKIETTGEVNLPSVSWNPGEIEKIGYIYRASCNCLNPDHSLTINKYDTMSILYFKCKVPKKEYGGLWDRTKTSLKILFGMDVTYEADFVFRGPEQVQELIDLLRTSKEAGHD